MAPTELLAQQHQRTMETLLAGTRPSGGASGGLHDRRPEARLPGRPLAAGALDLIVGTHALLSEGVSFRRLGLVITDEQHRFGVDQRAALGRQERGEGPAPCAGDVSHPHSPDPGADDLWGPGSVCH